MYTGPQRLERSELSFEAWVRDLKPWWTRPARAFSLLGLSQGGPIATVCSAPSRAGQPPDLAWRLCARLKRNDTPQHRKEAEMMNELAGPAGARTIRVPAATTNSSPTERPNSIAGGTN